MMKAKASVDVVTDFSSLYVEVEQEHSAGLVEGICGYRTKTIRSGSIIECEVYPIWKRSYARGIRQRRTRAAQQKQNHKNSIKHLAWLLNTNFTENDIWLTVTYSDDRLPKNDEQAYRDTVNYIRRLRRAAAKAKVTPLKYIIVTETHDEDGKPVRVHHHLVINFPDRDIAERLWQGGGRTQSRRLQPDENGLTGLAVYISKQKTPPRKGRSVNRRWRGSKNLKKPDVTVSDTQISRRAVKKILRMTDDERCTYFERLYRKNCYKCTEVRITYSTVVTGAYIHIKMRR